MRFTLVLPFALVILTQSNFGHAICASPSLVVYNDTTTSGPCPSTGSWMILYNLIVLSDLLNVDTVDGRTFIGGNLVDANNLATQSEFGMDHSLARLEVAGSVKSGYMITVSNGSVKVGSGSITGSSTIDGRSFWMSSAWLGAKVTLETELKNKAALIKYDVTKWSNQLKNLPTNNGYTKPSGALFASTAFVIDAKKVDANGVAVFNIVEGDLFGNSKVGSIDIRNTANAKAMVINVQGTYISWKNGYMTGGAILFQDGQSKILWNFYQAAKIDLGMLLYDFYGSFLAPFADVTAKSDIRGSVVVKSLSTTADIDYPTNAIGCQDPTVGLSGVASLVKSLV